MTTNHDIKLGVSLYSYQDSYYFHKHDLEGCIAAAAGAGAEGFEVFSDAMIKEWPYINDSFIDQWNGWMERYDIHPVCLDHFSDRAMWHDKNLTDDQLYERGVLYIKTAHKLGCKYIRLLHDAHIGTGISPYKLTTPEIVERLLPVARDNDVIMALECHSPSSIADPVHEPYLEVGERLGIPNIGLQADFSSYEYCLSTANIKLAVHYGCTQEVLEHLRDRQREAYFAGKPFVFNDIKADFNHMPLTEADKEYLDMSNMIFHESIKFMGMVPGSDYETLKNYASKLVYCHGKFYDIDEDGQVDNMDYPKIFSVLKEGGYKGYICSEFEGNRLMHLDSWCDDIDYVRRHHILMRQCLGYSD